MKPVLMCPQCIRNLPDDCTSCWECGIEGVKRKAPTPSNPGPVDVTSDPAVAPAPAFRFNPVAALLPLLVLGAVLVYHGPSNAGRVTIRTEPPGAVVRVEGRTLGVTPLQLEGNPGSYLVNIKLDDHEALDAQVVIPQGGATVADLPLKPLPRRKSRHLPGDPSTSLRIAETQTTARLQVASAVREL